MPQNPSTDQTLRAENAELRARLEESEETLRAIRAGEVDALVVEGDAGPQLFTLQGLDAEQNRLRSAMLSQVSEAVIATGPEDRITFLNSAAENQYRVRSADVLGRKLSEIYTREWPSPEAEAAALAALEECGHWGGEKLHRTRDGRVFPVEASIAILHDPDTGQRAGLIAVIRDITQRKEVEAALRRSTALFSKIIEQAPGGVYVVDAQFRLAQMNAESLPFFASVQPLIGRDFDEVLAIVWGPEIGPRCASIFRHTLATGERYVSPRFSEQRHDLGVEQAFEFETQRITLPDGQHGVVCYFQDVTARERAAVALRLANERLTLAVKCSQVVLFQQDLELRYTWMQNPARGFDHSVVMGKPDADLLERAEDAALIEALKREAIRSGVSQRQEVLVQVQGVGRDYNLLVEPLRDADDVITGITGAAIDITELKRAEAALAEANRQLATRAQRLETLVQQRTAKLTESIEELEGFCYSITHDMRAPLRAVNSFSQMLAEDYAEKLDDDGKRLLDRIRQSVTRMDKLILDVLQYSKVLRMDLKLEPVNADRLVRGMLDSYPDFQKPRANIVIEGEFPEVLANEAALTQCFSNLLNNAVKFVPAGTISRVTIRAEAVDSMVRFWIEDNGIGIEPKYLESIWGLFQQLTKEYEGTGVGLSIVRKAVERMGGKAGAESKPGQGSRFWFELNRANRASKTT